MSERPDMTPQPWPEACEPTTDELLPWFLEQSTEAQGWLIDRMRDAASEGRACWMKNHGPRLDHAESRVADLEAQNAHLRAARDEWARLYREAAGLPDSEHQTRRMERIAQQWEDAQAEIRRLRALVGDETTPEATS